MNAKLKNMFKKIGIILAGIGTVAVSVYAMVARKRDLSNGSGISGARESIGRIGDIVGAERKSIESEREAIRTERDAIEREREDINRERKSNESDRKRINRAKQILKTAKQRGNGKDSTNGR